MDLWGDFYPKKRTFPLSQPAKMTVDFPCIPNAFSLLKVEPLRKQHMLHPLFDTKNLYKNNYFSSQNDVFLKLKFKAHIL